MASLRRSRRIEQKIRHKTSLTQNFFPLLPREIRDQIYCYVLLAESEIEGPCPIDSLNVLYHQYRSTSLETFMHCPPGAANIIHAEYLKDALRYWRREPLTRLLRVSKAFCNEVREIIYSRLTLSWRKQERVHGHFRHNIQNFADDTLPCVSLGTRGLIRGIVLDIELPAIGNRRKLSVSQDYDSAKLRWKNTIAHLVWRLPGVRRVQAEFTFLPTDEPVNIQYTVKLALDILSPLQELEIWGLNVKAAEDPGRTKAENNTVVKIIERMQGAIRSGNW